MTEYIEREAALDIFGDAPMWQGRYESYPWEVHCAIVEIVKLVKEEIGKIPTSDVVPVVHSYWEHMILSDEENIDVCHNCKYPVSRFWRTTKYCPNCGAKMDGKDENDAN